MHDPLFQRTRRVASIDHFCFEIFVSTGACPEDGEIMHMNARPDKGVGSDPHIVSDDKSLSNKAKGVVGIVVCASAEMGILTDDCTATDLD